MNNKYPKVTGYYVYAHITPERDCYFGISKQQLCERWRPLHYKRGSLQPYIKKFGWDNIEHRVLFDNLTKRQAEIIEDYFISKARRDGFCINHNRSGGIKRDNKEEYDREWQQKYQQTEKWKAYQREYQRKRYQNNPEYREYQREYRLKKKLEKTL